ncbi:MAG: hypothetical protein AB1716_13515, partial [Planctomycetota bacterium]
MSGRTKSRLRRATVLVLALAAGLGLAYRYATNPARLRARALAALRALPIEGLEIGDVRFVPGEGLKASGIVVQPRRGGPLYQVPAGVEAPPLLSVAEARIEPRLLDLVLGRVRPRSIEMRGVRAAVVMPPGRAGATVEDASGPGEWLLQETLARAGRLPPIRIHDAEVEVLAIEGGRTRLVSRTLLRAAGAGTAAGYNLKVERRPRTDRPVLELDIGQSGDLRAAFDELDIRALVALLPERLARGAEALGLSGDISAREIVWRPAQDDPGASRRAPATAG